MTVADELPLDAVVGQLPANCRLNENFMVCDLGTLAPNVSAPPIRLTVRPTETNVGTMNNTVRVNATEIDPVPENNEASASTTVTPLAAINLAMKGESNETCAGKEILYTVSLGNDGPNAAPNTEMTVTIQPVLPLRLIEILPSNAGFTCEAAGTGALSCRNRSFNPTGATPPVMFKFAASVPSGTLNGVEFTGTATVKSEACDKGTAAKTASVKSSVRTRADVAITKIGSFERFGTGWKVTYHVNVTNVSDCDALNVGINDSLPENADFSSWKWSAGGECNRYGVGGERIVCLWKGATTKGATNSRCLEMVLTMPLKPSSQTITNRASAITDTPEDITANNYSPLKLRVGETRPGSCPVPLPNPSPR